MKITATISLASLGLASAFVETPRGAVKSQGVPLRAKKSRRQHKLRDQARDVNVTIMPMTDEEDRGYKRRTAPQMSQALPFAQCPRTLDGTMAGDAGFDPLGFADNFDNLANYREAEVKHARLAMLAAAGWPLSELWDGKLARFLDLEPGLNADGRVPSVLNGGMGKISIGYWVGCLVFAGAIDVYSSYFADKKRAGYFPGDLGFDPLGFYPRGTSTKEIKTRDNLRLSEIKHGRLAMIAITVFAFTEFATHTPIVDTASVFFRPITEVLSDQVPQYYIPPEVATTPLVEAASVVVPEVVAPAVVEAAAIIAPEVTAPAAVEAVLSAPIEAVAPSIAAPPGQLAEAQARIAGLEELTAAKIRIVELEDKLKMIDALTR